METTYTLSRDRSIITERIIVLRAPIGAPAGAVHTREVSESPLATRSRS